MDIETILNSMMEFVQTPIGSYTTTFVVGLATGYIWRWRNSKPQRTEKASMIEWQSRYDGLMAKMDSLQPAVVSYIQRRKEAEARLNTPNKARKREELREELTEKFMAKLTDEEKEDPFSYASKELEMEDKVNSIVEGKYPSVLPEPPHELGTLLSIFDEWIGCRP